MKVVAERDDARPSSRETESDSRTPSTSIRARMRPSPSLGRILPITIGQILAAPHPGGASNSSSSSSTVARGWVSSLRLQKNLAFIELNDGTAKKGLQVVVQGKKGSSELRA